MIRSKRKIVYVRWIDAGEHGGTNVDPDDIDPVTELESVGLFAKEDDTYLTLAMDRHMEGSGRNSPGAIVKANITERREMSVESFRKYRRSIVKR